ncbi:YppG family protein [Halobacillus litoralis]|uniref:YppG family protein n=1 Tax=Halobacillus litoralis TaxID=45668 RepID=UPI001CD2BB44|nr:YppG family protein [Halobacillus litoralis]MCA0972804.1 YppG family protein [Halobacillus litoralis]
MYPYNNQWQDWTRYQSAYVHGKNAYQNQNRFPNQQVPSYPMYGYYGYQMPQASQPYSYGFPGYTENAEYQNAAFQNTAGNGSQAAKIPKTVMNYFQDDEGQFDFDKMMSTTGQMMKTFQQVSPLVKGLGTFVKGIK